MTLAHDLSSDTFVTTALDRRRPRSRCSCVATVVAGLQAGA